MGPGHVLAVDILRTGHGGGFLPTVKIRRPGAEPEDALEFTFQLDAAARLFAQRIGCGKLGSMCRVSFTTGIDLIEKVAAAEEFVRRDITHVSGSIFGFVLDALREGGHASGEVGVRIDGGSE